MKKGDYVFIVKKEVMSGDKRPSLAKIIHVDKEGNKALVESTYKLLHPNLPAHSSWVVPLGTCIPISKHALDVAARSRPKHIDTYANALVCWADQDGRISEGIVVKSTLKTVEILRSGDTAKIIRKKKDLIVKL